MGKLKIYLDNCCFNRPYDDLSDDIVRFESESVLTIIARCEQHKWEICGSDVLLEEIEMITDIVKKEKVLTLYSSALTSIELNTDIIIRAKQLGNANIKPFDALHIASAEYGNADVFLTTDKKLINAAQRISLNVKVYNPAIWLMEVLYNV